MALKTNYPSRLRGRGVEVSKTLFYFIGNFSLRRNLELKSPDKTGREKANCGLEDVESILPIVIVVFFS